MTRLENKYADMAPKVLAELNGYISLFRNDYEKVVRRLAPSIQMIEHGIEMFFVPKGVGFPHQVLPPLNMSSKQILEIAVEFFDSLDKNFGQRIRKEIGRGDFQMAEPILSEKRPSSHCGFKKGNYFCHIYPENNAMGVVVTSHELAHGTDEMHHIDARPKDPEVHETSPDFFERLCIDFLLQKGLIDLKGKNSFYLDKLRECNYKRMVILCEYKIMQEFIRLTQNGRQLSMEDVDGIFERLCNGGPGKPEGVYFSEKKVEETIYAITLGMAKSIGVNLDGTRKAPDEKERGTMALYEFRYVFGQIVANELYKQYQKNPTLLQDFISKILDKSYSLTQEEMLKFVGKPFEQLCKEFSEDGNKSVKDLVPQILPSNPS